MACWATFSGEDILENFKGVYYNIPYVYNESFFKSFWIVGSKTCFIYFMQVSTNKLTNLLKAKLIAYFFTKIFDNCIYFLRF